MSATYETSWYSSKFNYFGVDYRDFMVHADKISQQIVFPYYLHYRRLYPIQSQVFEGTPEMHVSVVEAGLPFDGKSSSKRIITSQNGHDVIGGNFSVIRIFLYK